MLEMSLFFSLFVFLLNQGTPIVMLKSGSTGSQNQEQQNQGEDNVNFSGVTMEEGIEGVCQNKW